MLHLQCLPGLAEAPLPGRSALQRGWEEEETIPSSNRRVPGPGLILKREEEPPPMATAAEEQKIQQRVEYTLRLAPGA